MERKEQVILKNDSGPGCLMYHLLAALWLIGMYNPGVLNLIAVTQKTIQNSGPFKTRFWSKIDFVTQK